MTRDEKIKRLVEKMQDWDFNTLIGWAQDQMESILISLPPDDLDEEYKNFGDIEE